MTKKVRIPYKLGQDEDLVWCASSQLAPGVGAVGDGPSREEAVADLEKGLRALIDEVGVPATPLEEHNPQATGVLELEVG